MSVASGARDDRSLLAEAGLVALLTLITLELVRSSGPLLDLAYSRGGVVRVARDALLVYAAPGPLAALLLLVGRRRRSVRASSLVGFGVVVLVALRLVVQALEGGARFVVGLAAVAVAILVLSLAVTLLAGRPQGGRLSAAAVSAGAAAGVGLQLALGTWDVYWRHNALGWSVAVAIALSALALAARVVRRPQPEPLTRVRRLWALGPFLALAAMMLANPAFAASQAGVPLALAGPLTALGLLAASWLAVRPGRVLLGRYGRGTAAVTPWAVAVALAVLILVVLGDAGGPGHSVLVLAALLVAHLLSVHALGHALEPGKPLPVPGSVLSTSGNIFLVGLLTIGPLLAYQVDYDVPLGFPHQLVLGATAAGLGVAGVRRRSAMRSPASARTARGLPLLWVASGGLVLVGAAIAGAAWLGNAPPHLAQGAARPTTGRVLTWNLHYGVSPQGAVDLETTARTIEAQDPDAVLLQEVSRGWVLGGGEDMATWLSERLNRPFVFARAADGQFGNVILSRGQASEVEVQPLPYGAGPQHRSAVTARVSVGNRTLLVTSVHLQQRAGNTPTRLLELRTLLTALGTAAAPARIVGGDLNATPGSDEVDLVEAAGFVSAVDTAGDAGAVTSPSIHPARRIDWVLGRGITFREAHVLTEAQTSDHLPVVATVSP